MMTEDTKKALEILKPICDLLHMEIDADENIMTINGQKVGIAFNSIYATVMEGIGYLFYEAYANRFRAHILSDETKDVIKRYWVYKTEGGEIV